VLCFSETFLASLYNQKDRSSETAFNSAVMISADLIKRHFEQLGEENDKKVMINICTKLRDDKKALAAIYLT
jgi:hypothetical protein